MIARWQLDLATNHADKDAVVHSCINAMIDMGRSVTLVMQKESGARPAPLREWYEGRMAELLNSPDGPLLKFFNARRVYTVHQGVDWPKKVTAKVTGSTAPGVSASATAIFWRFEGTQEYLGPEDNGGMMRLSIRYLAILPGWSRIGCRSARNSGSSRLALLLPSRAPRPILSGMDAIPEEFRDKRTQAERDQSSALSYWMYAVEYGVHYYLAGRYSMFARFTPTCGNQMHHAVELLLKACLARNDTWQQILAYGARGGYGHDLEKLWGEFKKRNPDPALAAHDDVIKGLNKFEDIRYPEGMIQGGAMLSIGLYDVAPEHRTRPAGTPGGAFFTPEERRFYLD